jgi:hypothetical protein|tara:strand:+ start:330 stop:653 length:324 start_codon:yes stop_codon:yes gene_type:complete
MSIVKDIKKLCTPAYVYLVISAIAMIGLILQNAGNVDKYCVGSFECGVPNTAMVFVGKALYIAFWTFVLNSLCKAGYKSISWFFVLMPFILFFIVLGLVLLNQGVSQ